MVSYPDKLKQSDMGSNIIVLLYDQPLNLIQVRGEPQGDGGDTE